MQNKAAAGHAGWPVQFRFAVDAGWSLVPELWTLDSIDMRVRTVHILKAVLLLPALFSALAWTESFARHDIVWILCPKGGIVVSSSAGKLHVLLHTHGSDGWTVQHQSLPAEEPNRIDPRFQFHVFPTALDATFPHWFLVLLLGLPTILYLLLGQRSVANPKLPFNKRLYTYNVICSFNLQYSFSDSEVEQDPGGDEGDFNPTDKAIRTLEKDLQETLGQNYAITKFEAYAESDELLGISDEKGNIIPPNNAALQDTLASIDPVPYGRAVDALVSARSLAFFGLGNAAVVAREAYYPAKRAQRSQGFGRGQRRDRTQ